MESYNDYLPTIQRLQECGQERLPNKSPILTQARSSSPPINRYVSVYSSLHQKLLQDELFLPSQVKTGKISLHSDGGFIERNSLHLAQTLPGSAEDIYRLPACFIAGLDPSHSSNSSPAGYKTPDNTPGSLRVTNPDEVHLLVASRHGTSDVNDEGGDLRCSENQGDEYSLQTFDPVNSARVPSHHDLYRPAGKEDLQPCSSPAPKTPLRSPFEISCKPVDQQPNSKSRDKESRSTRAHLRKSRAVQKLPTLEEEVDQTVGGANDVIPSEPCGGESSSGFDPVASGEPPAHRRVGKYLRRVSGYLDLTDAAAAQEEAAAASAGDLPYILPEMKRISVFYVSLII